MRLEAKAKQHRGWRRRHFGIEPLENRLLLSINTDLIINGGFETGNFAGWQTQNSGPGAFVVNNGSVDPASPEGPLAPYEGAFGALSNPGGPGTHVLYQDVAIPAGTLATLRWVDRIHNFANVYQDPNQEYRVEIRDTSEHVLATVFSTNPGDPLTSDWTQRSADLTAFAGQTVRIAFVETATLNFLNVHLDNVQLENGPASEIHGSKWNDLDGNGVRGGNEPGLPGWTIYLDTNQNAVLDPGETSTITDANGNYSFTNLPADTYIIREVMQSGWEQTFPDPHPNTNQRLFGLQSTTGLPIIYELDPITGQAIHSFVVPAPVQTVGMQDLAVGPNSLFYIDGSGSGPHTLWELNLDTGAVIDSDVVDANAPVNIKGLAYLNDKLYISEQSSVSTILAWDPINDIPLTAFNLQSPLNSYGFVGAPDLGLLYGIDFSGRVTAINPLLHGVVNTFFSGVSSIRGLAYINGQLLATTSAFSQTVYRLDPFSGASVGSVSLSGVQGQITTLGGDGLGPNQLITNGSFEWGDFTGWTTAATYNVPFPWQTAIYGDLGPYATIVPAHGYFAAANGFSNNQTFSNQFVLYQDVNIPIGTVATLSWKDRMRWQASSQIRTFQLQIRNPATNEILSTPHSFNTTLDSTDTGWQFHSVDLSSYAGSSVRVYFVEEVPGGNNKLAQFEIDDIRLTASPVGSRHYLELAAGQIATDVNFGDKSISFPAEIHGTRWNDLDADGVRDAGESGLPGRTIYLDIDRDGKFDSGEPSTITDGNGNYAFTNLFPGDYAVNEVMQTEWRQTSPDAVAASLSQRMFVLRTVNSVATIYELDPNTGNTINSFPVPEAIQIVGPQGLAVGPNSLFYIDGSSPPIHTLWELDPDTGAVIDSDIVSSGEIDGLAYLDGKVYLEQDSSGTIFVWDPIADTMVTSLSVPVGLLGGLAGAADQGFLFATTNSGNIVSINPANGMIIRAISGHTYPNSTGLAYANGKLFASSSLTPDFVRVIDSFTGVLLQFIPVGGTGTISALGGDGAIPFQQLIVNGSFETGNFDGWTTNSSPIPYQSWNVTWGSPPGGYGPPYPPNGFYEAWVGGLYFSSFPASAYLYQDVDLPAEMLANLTWKDREQGFSSSQPATFQVQVRDPVTNAIVETAYSYTLNGGDTGWRSHSINLSSYAGSKVRIYFVTNFPPTPSSSQFELDAVSLLATPSSVPHDLTLAVGQIATDIDFGNVVKSTVNISVTDPIAAEPSTDTATFTITRNGTAGNLIVNYATDGTASIGPLITGIPNFPGDYSALTGSVTILDGQSSATVTITPIDDGNYEFNETVVLTLLRDDNYNLGTIKTASAVIADNDNDLDFSRNPGWSGSNRTLQGNNLGWSPTTNQAGGLAGEIGGTIARSHKDTYYADTFLSQTLNLHSYVIIGTGKFDILNISPGWAGTGESGLFLGHFSTNVASKEFIGLELKKDPNGLTTQLQVRARLQVPDGTGFTATPWNNISINGNHTFRYVYSPASGGNNGQLALILDDQLPQGVALTASDQLSNAQFNAFGLGYTSNLNSENAPTKTIQVFLDDVQYTGYQPGVSVVATDSSAAEQGLNPGVFTITRTNAKNDLVVNYLLTGKATSGSDYAALPSSVIIPNGSTSATITVTPVNDSTAEGDENVVLSLMSGGAYHLSTPYNATVKIADNDLFALDNFENGNGAGGLGWNGAWTLGGTATVTSAGSPNTGSFHLQLTGNGATATRAVSLAGAASARVVLDWKASSFETGETAVVEVFNGTNWLNLLTILDTQDDNVYHHADLVVPAAARNASFQLRIRTLMSSADDLLYIDDVQVVV